MAVLPVAVPRPHKVSLNLNQKSQKVIKIDDVAVLDVAFDVIVAPCGRYGQKSAPGGQEGLNRPPKRISKVTHFVDAFRSFSSRSAIPTKTRSVSNPHWKNIGNSNSPCASKSRVVLLKPYYLFPDRA